MLALLADVERGDRAVIAHHACPHLAKLAFVISQGDVGGGRWRRGGGLHVVPPGGCYGSLGHSPVMPGSAGTTGQASRADKLSLGGEAFLVAARAEPMLA